LKPIRKVFFEKRARYNCYFFPLYPPLHDALAAHLYFPFLLHHCEEEANENCCRGICGIFILDHIGWQQQQGQQTSREILHGCFFSWIYPNVCSQSVFQHKKTLQNTSQLSNLFFTLVRTATLASGGINIDLFVYVARVMKVIGIPARLMEKKLGRREKEGRKNEQKISEVGKRKLITIVYRKMWIMHNKYSKKLLRKPFFRVGGLLQTLGCVEGDSYLSIGVIFTALISFIFTM
jgi:hypothetical protein